VLLNKESDRSLSCSPIDLFKRSKIHLQHLTLASLSIMMTQQIMEERTLHY